jgi:hypothetical protein
LKRSRPNTLIALAVSPDGIGIVTKVLCVEHDDNNLYMLKMRLERVDDFEVLAADDSEKGYEVALTSTRT